MGVTTSHRASYGRWLAVPAKHCELKTGLVAGTAKLNLLDLANVSDCCTIAMQPPLLPTKHAEKQTAGLKTLGPLGL